MGAARQSGSLDGSLCRVMKRVSGMTRHEGGESRVVTSTHQHPTGVDTLFHRHGLAPPRARAPLWHDFPWRCSLGPANVRYSTNRVDVARR